MKRNWDVVQNILEHIEAGDINTYFQNEGYLNDLGIDEDVFLGHVEIMLDAGIIKHCTVSRASTGKFAMCSFNGVFITMYGHDLLDAMRNKSFWTKLKAKAVSSGLTLSWEFIKVAIPVVIKESL